MQNQADRKASRRRAIAHTITWVVLPWLVACKKDEPAPPAPVTSVSTAAPAPSAPPATRETVNISLFSWPGYGFWFIAKEKNLAPELDLQIQIIEDPIQSYTLMASGKLDVISSTIEYAPIAAETKNPARLVTLANLSYGTDKLVLGPKVKTAADLKGKSVAVLEGGLSQIYMGIWLSEQGVGIKEVKFVNLVMDDAAGAMVSGKVGAAELWEPFGAKVLSALSGSRVVAQSKEPAWLERALLAEAMYMSADFIGKRRSVAEATLRAHYAALDYWSKHTAEANAIIAKAIKFDVKDVESVIGTTGKSQDGGLYMYDRDEAARFMGVKPGEPPFGQKNGQVKEHFRLTNEWWIKFGLMKTEAPFDGGVDTSVLAAVIR